MKLLVEAGLVTREQRGKWAYYRVVPETMAAISQTLRGPAALPPPTRGSLRYPSCQSRRALIRTS